MPRARVAVSRPARRDLSRYWPQSTIFAGPGGLPLPYARPGARALRPHAAANRIAPATFSHKIIGKRKHTPATTPPPRPKCCIHSEFAQRKAPAAQGVTAGAKEFGIIWKLIAHSLIGVNIEKDRTQPCSGQLR